MLNRIVDDIKGSLESGHFFAALTLALTLPDICGKAEYPDEKSKKRYIQWFDDNIGDYDKEDADDLPYMSGEMIYNLRNSLLHQGTPNISAGDIKEEQCRVDRFLLTISDVSYGGISMLGKDMDDNVTGRGIEINIVNLCAEISRAAQMYYKRNIEKFDFFNYELRDMRKGNCKYWF